MAGVLADGGFPQEALAPMLEAVETALQSLAYVMGQESDEPVTLSFIESQLVSENMVPPEAPPLVAQLRESPAGDEESARALFERACGLLDHVAEALNRAALK